MKQDALCNENVDELKKKVLELCDTIDKQNDLIKKYQKALMIAASDLEEVVIEGGGCYCSCPIVDYCEPDDREECTEKFLRYWKEEVGLE